MQHPTVHIDDIERQLAELAICPIQQLRIRWQAIFRSKPPAAFGPDLLRRAIAQKLQLQRIGGLPANVQRQINQLVTAAARKPTGKIELPRRIKAGAMLVRTWKGTAHRVTVLDAGFKFEGRPYSSLSEIAREITGSRWNGPRFFGLRSKDAAVSKPAQQIGMFDGLEQGVGFSSKPHVAAVTAEETAHGA